MLRKAVGVNTVWQIVVVSDSLIGHRVVYLIYCEFYLSVVAMDLQRKDL